MQHILRHMCKVIANTRIQACWMTPQTLTMLGGTHRGLKGIIARICVAVVRITLIFPTHSSIIFMFQFACQFFLFYGIHHGRPVLCRHQAPAAVNEGSDVLLKCWRIASAPREHGWDGLSSGVDGVVDHSAEAVAIPVDTVVAGKPL